MAAQPRTAIDNLRQILEKYPLKDDVVTISAALLRGVLAAHDTALAKAVALTSRDQDEHPTLSKTPYTPEELEALRDRIKSYDEHPVRIGILRDCPDYDDIYADDRRWLATIDQRDRIAADGIAAAMYEELRFVKPKPPWPAWAWAVAFQKVVGIEVARAHGLTSDIVDTKRSER